MSIAESTFLGLFFFNDTATTEIYTLSLHDALPIFEMIKQSCRFRGDIKHRNAVLVLAETCAHRHLAIRMKGEALNPVTHVFDHAGDRGYFQRQINDRYVAKLGAEWHGTLTNQRQFPVQADAKNIRYIKQFRIDSRFYFHLTQVTHLVVDKRIPMDGCRIIIEKALGRNDTIALWGDPKAGEPVVLRTAADFDQLAIPNRTEERRVGKECRSPGWPWH